MFGLKKAIFHRIAFFYWILHFFAQIRYFWKNRVRYEKESFSVFEQIEPIVFAQLHSKKIGFIGSEQNSIGHSGVENLGHQKHIGLIAQKHLHGVFL